MSWLDSPKNKMYLEVLIISWVVSLVGSGIVGAIRYWFLILDKGGNVIGIKWFGKLYYYIIGIDLSPGVFKPLILITLFGYFCYRIYTDEELEEELKAAKRRSLFKELHAIAVWLWKLFFSFKTLGYTFIVLSALELTQVLKWKINPMLYAAPYLSLIMGLLITVALLLYLARNIKEYLTFVALIGAAIVFGLASASGLFNKVKVNIQDYSAKAIEFIFSISTLKPSILTFTASEALYVDFIGVPWAGIVVRFVLGGFILFFNKRMTKFVENTWKGIKGIHKENLMPILYKITGDEPPKTAEDLLKDYGNEAEASTEAGFYAQVVRIVQGIKEGHYARDEGILELKGLIESHRNVEAKEKLEKKLGEKFEEAENFDARLKKAVEEIISAEKERRKKRK